MSKKQLWKQFQDAVKTLLDEVDSDPNVSLALSVEALGALADIRETMEYFEEDLNED